MIDTQVIANTGRNKGQVGTVTGVAPGAVWVDFNRLLRVNEGFGSVSVHPDAYWVLIENVSPAELTLTQSEHST